MTRHMLAFAGAVVVAVVLSGCVSTAQQDDAGETSVAGRPGSGAGGSGGGSGGGTGAGGAAGGASGGIQSLPGAVPPTAAGLPSMPQDGSKPNPAPSTTSRSATGMPGADAGSSPNGGPPTLGTTQSGSDRGGETTGELTPDGVPNASGRPTGSDNANAAGQPGQTGGEISASESEVDGSGDEVASGAEAGDSGDEIGASVGDADESGDESGQNGSGEELGVNVAEVGQDISGTDGGPMTTAARRAAIRARLDASYATIDRVTLEERERVRRAASTGMGRGGSNEIGEENGGGGDGTGERSTVIASNSAGTGGAAMPGGRTARVGEFDDGNAASTYPVPADIPGGDDDDVVASQLREAAMHEADPDLRAKLWDEYRKYLGLGLER